MTHDTNDAIAALDEMIASLDALEAAIEATDDPAALAELAQLSERLAAIATDTPDE